MISIIVPIYKVEKYLRQCVDSILNQTYSNLEILLIDDGSPDNCGVICDEFAEKDRRVRAFHTGNRGLSAARNLGLREARGEYIGFVDSDDWIDPNLYEVLLKMAVETGADLSVCGVCFEFPEQTIESVSAKDGVLTKQEALEGLIHKELKNYVWNKLYRRELWEGISFPEGREFEDIAVLHKVILKTDRAVSVSKCLYHYRQRVDSITTTKTMSNLADFWKAYYGRYIMLKENPGVKENDELMRILREQVAICAMRTWRWVYRIPKKERSKEHLKKVSCFMREEFPPFGEAGWSRSLRAFAFLARYDNAVSYAAGYLLNMLYLQKHKLLKERFL